MVNHVPKESSEKIISPTLFGNNSCRPIVAASSIGGMIFALCSHETCLTIIDHSHTKLTRAVTMYIALVLSYIAFFSIGMGPIISVYSSEIFPLRLCAQGYAIGVVF